MKKKKLRELRRKQAEALVIKVEEPKKEVKVVRTRKPKVEE